jgi:hypothetical protein
MVLAAHAERRNGDGDRGALMPRKRRPGPKKRRGPKKGSRRQTLEWFAEFEHELESALQLKSTHQSHQWFDQYDLSAPQLKNPYQPKQESPLQEPTGKFCFLLPVLSMSQKAQLLRDANFTKRFGIQSAGHLRQLLAELRDIKRSGTVRFNRAKLTYVFGKDKN